MNQPLPLPLQPPPSNFEYLELLTARAAVFSLQTLPTEACKSVFEFSKKLYGNVAIFLSAEMIVEICKDIASDISVRCFVIAYADRLLLEMQIDGRVKFDEISKHFFYRNLCYGDAAQLFPDEVKNLLFNHGIVADQLLENNQWLVAIYLGTLTGGLLEVSKEAFNAYNGN